MAGPARRSATERQPKYLRIYTELRDRIIGGQWPAGSSLPAQRELADEFGVSMMTLRQALQLLADEGLVGTRHGLGTYVAPRFAHDLGHLRSFASDLAAQGAEVTTRLLDAAALAPPEAVGARLGGPAEVLRLRRLRLVGGRPVILQTSYLPVPLPGGVDPRDLVTPTDRGAPAGDPDRPAADGDLGRHGGDPRHPADGRDPDRPADGGDPGLYTLLADRGLAVARATETITPTVLAPGDARDLGRPAGSPALLSHRISFTAAGDPVIDDHALLPGDSVAITANRSADQIKVSYTLAASPPAAPS
ncbi:MAG TPA: GntR family transcriptional regulator [Streptosporangiaceae bacterium]|nr:GntR family transcriptional regulator [Streptosporangiaceae bacterium]